MEKAKLDKLVTYEGIPPLEKAKIYKSMDPEYIKEISSSRSYYNRFLFEISVIVGDYDTTLRILNLYTKMENIPEFIMLYFAGVAYNKEAINILDSVIDTTYPVRVLLAYVKSLKDNPEVIIHAKYVYDTIELHEKIEGHIRLNFIDTVYEPAYYEFLFQTGYYPYSYFQSLSTTPKLAEWLAITDV